MRRFVILSALVALLLGLVPAAVQAAPATRVEERAIVVQCETATDDGFVSMTVALSDDFPSFGDLAFWEEDTEPFAGAPAWVSSSANVEGDATGLTVSFELVEFDETQEPPFGDPAGTALLTVTLSPDGDAFDVEERFRNGNRWERVTGTIQPLALDGSLELPGADLESLEGCSAVEQNLTFFSTSPSAFTDRFREFVGSCTWEDGSETVGLFVRGDAFGAFGDVFVSGPDMEVGGSTEVAIGEGVVSFDVELFDFGSEAVVGSATVEATFAPTGEFFRTVEVFGIDRVKIRGEAFTVDGTLEVTLDGTTTAYPIDDEHCDAADQVVSIHAVVPAGPKPGPLANDAPEGATALRLGRVARIVTGGNAVAAEVPCSTDFPENEGPAEVPFGYTAWWTVTGTGGDMTVDTAGSTFDTVVAVYTLENGVFEQVVCVDDVFDEAFSLQARATWASEAGVTYYIQAGGFDTSAGRLQLVVN